MAQATGVNHEIEADNVAGVQVLEAAAIDTFEELRTELAALRQEVDRVLEGSEATAAKEVRTTLDSTARELERREPSRDLVVPKLEKAAEILDKGARMTDAADKLGKSMAKLVPLAKALWLGAAALFGA